MSREMKDSGVEWIGEIPENWATRKIKFSLNERIEKNDPIKSKNILSLTAKQGVIPLSEREGGGNKPKEDFSAYKLAYPGDIVMNSMNIISGSVGLSNYFGCMSPVYYMLRPVHKEDDARFYNYVFQSKPFQLSLFGLGNGILVKQTDNDKFNTVRLRIPMDKLGDVEIPNISSTEQQQIVHFLDRKCIAIDTAIEKTKKSIEKLEEYKKAVITKAVTKGIDPNAKMKDSGVEWIGEIPEDWNIRKIKNCIVNCFGGCWGEDEKPQNRHLCIRIADFDFDKQLVKSTASTMRSYTQIQLANGMLEDGDIILEKSGGGEKTPVGRTVLYDKKTHPNAMFANFCNVLRPSIETDNKYFAYILKSLYQTTGMRLFFNQTTGIQNLNMKEYLNACISFPLLTEQQQIVHFLDRKCTAIDTAIEKKKKAIEKWEEYKKSLIYYTVTGKIDCRNEVIE